MDDYKKILQKIKMGEALDFMEKISVEHVFDFYFRHGHHTSPQSRLSCRVKKEEIDEEPFFLELKEEEDKEEDKEDKEKKDTNQSGKLTEIETPRKNLVFGVNDTKKLSSRNILVEYEDKDVSVADLLPVVQKKKCEIIDHGNSVFTLKKRNRIIISSYNGFCINGRNPTIRSYNWQLLSNLRTNFSDLSYGNTLISFLKEPTKDSAESLKKCIRNALLNVRILYSSEFVLSCVLFGFFLSWGKNNDWEGLKIFSLDGKMDEIHLSQSKITCFRCDLICFYNKNMFIFEYKYLNNRPENLGNVAIECIKERKYIKRATDYIFSLYPEEMVGLSNIYGVGLGFSDRKDDILTYVEYEDFGKPKEPDNINYIREKLKEHQEKKNKNQILKKIK